MVVNGKDRMSTDAGKDGFVQLQTEKGKMTMMRLAETRREKKLAMVMKVKNQRERGWGRDEAFRFRRTEANGKGVCRRGTEISSLK